MHEGRQSTVSRGFKLALLLSGWTVALWLAFQPPMPPVIFTGKPRPAPEVKTLPDAVPSVLDARLRDVLARGLPGGASVGFCVLDEAGEIISSNPLAETAMCPASALKTVTTGAALGILGPDFRFKTRVESTARIGDDGALAGDLVLVGGGDPTLSAADLDRLAKTVVDAGLKVVRGRLRVDASVFPHHPMSDHWNWGDIGNAYGVGAFGLNLGYNRMLVSFDPADEPGKPARVIGPAVEDVEWVNHVLTGPAGSGDGVVVYSEPYGKRVTLRGTVPLGERGFAVRAAVPDPPAMASRVLSAALRKHGVRVLGEDVIAPGEATEILAVHESAALPEILTHLHRVSDNLEAQCLFLMIGRETGADPAAAVRGYWEKQGVGFKGLRLLDGSGLARANMIRPLDLARVNLAARRSEHGGRFHASLSELRPGRVRAKNGAMSGVRTEVGFIRKNDGSEWTFALMTNGLTGAFDFRAYRNAVLDVLEAAE